MDEPAINAMPSTPEADRLVKLVLNGDTQSFAGLIRLYETEIWRIASTLVRDWAATESLVQQAFIEAYSHLHQYQIGTNFGAWLRTITRNRLRKELRSIVRAEQRLAKYREQLIEQLQRNEAVHDDADLYLTALRGCRALLPDADAQLLQWRYEKGLSFEMIAERALMTPAAVQRAISRIRYRLRACIEGQLKTT